MLKVWSRLKSSLTYSDAKYFTQRSWIKIWLPSTICYSNIKDWICLSHHKLLELSLVPRFFVYHLIWSSLSVTLICDFFSPWYLQHGKNNCDVLKSFIFQCVWIHHIHDDKNLMQVWNITIFICTYIDRNIYPHSVWGTSFHFMYVCVIFLWYGWWKLATLWLWHCNLYVTHCVIGAKYSVCYTCTYQDLSIVVSTSVFGDLWHF